MSNKEGTIKVRNWNRIILLCLAMLGTALTFIIYLFAVVLSDFRNDTITSFLILGLTLFHFSMIIWLISLVISCVTNEEYFKEKKVKIL